MTELRRGPKRAGFVFHGVWIGMGASRLHWFFDRGFAWGWAWQQRDERYDRRRLLRL